MGKQKATPQPGSSGMKQKSIASFFAAKPKTKSSTPKKSTKPGPTATTDNKENVISAAPAAAHTPPPCAEAADAPAVEQHTPAAAGGPALPPSEQQQQRQQQQQQQPPPAKEASAAGTSPKPPKPAAAGAAGGAAAAGSGGGSSGGAAVVGRRLRVFWPLDKKWFSGRITEYRDGEGTHRVKYDDGDDEWIDLAKEQHKLLPPGSSAKGGNGGKAGAASKRRRNARIESDSDDDDDDDGGDGAGSEDDSDFKAGGEDEECDDEEMCDLESEGAAADSGAADEEEEDDEEELCDDDDDDDVGAGSKRKRPPSKAARKRPASTPASAAAGAAGSGSGPRAAAASGTAAATGGAAVPSSAGHTPMGRFSCGAGKATPPQGFFPSQTATPPVGAVGGGGGGASTAAAAGSSGFAAPAGVTPGGSVGQGATPGSTPASHLAFGAATPPSALTPDTAAKAALQGALDLTPAPGGAAGKTEPRLVLGVLASGGAEAARFAARMAERFSFLHPDRIKDKAGRRPGEPDYDPRTLRIPDNFFKQHKVTEAQQQWWGFKASNFDSVLLFKVGKFYEMFEMDAFVGVDVCGLSLMKGEQPHAGFPEAAYHTMAEQLARAGYRVVVVEQTETPEQLKARNARRPPGAKAVNVVERQAVAVLSRGTLMDPEMVAAHPDAAYVLAVVEVSEEGGHDAPFIGVAALDAAAGQLLVGSWRDDEVRLKLRTQLTGLRPVEVVLPRRTTGGPMSAVTSRLVRCGASRGAAPALNELPAGAGNADNALKALSKYFPGDLPPLLAALAQQYQQSPAPSGDEGEQQQQQRAHAARVSEAALGAVGLMVTFLAANMLDRALLPHAKYEALCEGAAGSDDPVAMELNGAALEGLEVLENALGGPQGSLLGLLDHATTPFGRRRLRRWLTRPLFRAGDITARQDAVEELMGPADAAVGAARRALAGCSDIERCLARLAASVGGGGAVAAAGAEDDGGGSGGGSGGGGGFGREAAHVVLYEDVARRRVKVLVALLRDLRALQAALEAFSQASPSSALLAALVEPTRWAELATRLTELGAAAEWGKAEADGVVRPSRAGVDPDYDAATADVDATDQALKAYLGRVRQQLDCRAVTYVSLNKDSHVLEVPEGVAGRVPRAYALVGHRKGFKRYTSEELRELVAERAAAEEAREGVQAGVLRNLERLFVSHQELWASALEAVGVLDCLMALAGAATAADGAMCRPQLLPHPTDGEGRPRGGIFRARGLRHPAGVAGGGCASFVPNDITLGGGGEGEGGEGEGGAGGAGLILLTGPNMGGKSTLLRQVCLAAVLAQVGAMVPADSLALTPMDGCFVRMGARDSILTGQSTFYIEMAETAAMLSRAGPRSLVALDELGRGTATLDGAAIAAAVLDHLSSTTHCCGLFATHYHQLADAHAADPNVAIMHMACAVAEAPQRGAAQQEGSGGAAAADAAGEEDEVAEVTFLYKLSAGACPRSYGTNVARLAGLPASVVRRAGEMSASREATYCSGTTKCKAAATAATGAAAQQGGGEAQGQEGEMVRLLRDVRAQLQQLQQAGGEGGDSSGGAGEKLLQLQQRAALLCQG